MIVSVALRILPSMHNVVTTRKIDDTHFWVDAEEWVYLDLSDRYAFFTDNYKWDRRYKAGFWDGKRRLFKPSRPVLSLGLLWDFLRYCKKAGLKVEFEGDWHLPYFERVTEQEVSFFYGTLGLPDDIVPHDYQVRYVAEALSRKRRILESPTGSGKSLMVYGLVRYLLDRRKASRILIVVPTVMLVTQMLSDFKEDYGWADAESRCHLISGGKGKDFGEKDVVITTWQSVYKMPAEWFRQFDALIGDEAHECEGKSLTQIIEAASCALYKVGLSGTLRTAKLNQLVLTGLFGEPVKHVSTIELIERGVLERFKVYACVLNYSDEDRKRVAGFKYHDELKWLSESRWREDVLFKLIEKAPGNSLVLFSTIEHGKRMMARAAEQFPDRNIYYVAGEVAGDEREVIRRAVNEEADSVTFASFQTFQRGVNIRNLVNLFLASGTKSKIRILQSIGRVLRRSTISDWARLFDIVDNLKWESRENYSLKHARERMREYHAEKFPVEVKNFSPTVR